MASKFYTNLYKTGRAVNAAAVAKSKHESISPTGDPSVDWTLGGGWARYRLNLIYGPSKSCKSFVAMHAAIEEQKRTGGDIVIFDSEYYFDDPAAVQRLADMGADLDKVHIISSNQLGILFGNIADLETDLKQSIAEDDPKKKNLNLCAIIIDSLGGIQVGNAENKILKGEVDEAGDAGRGNAKYINPVLGFVLRLCAEYKVTGFAVQHCIKNQEKYGPEYLLTGGERLKFLSNTILFLEGSTAKDSVLVGDGLRVDKEIKVEAAKGMAMVGKKILVRCEKTRNTTENKKAEFFINLKEAHFARAEESLFNLAKKLGVLYHPLSAEGKTSVSWYEFRKGDCAPMKFNGEAQTTEAMTDKTLFNDIYEACMASDKSEATEDEISEVKND
jgi:RecA/RadA recombinase